MTTEEEQQLAEITGPYYDTTALAELLNVSTNTIAEQTAAGSLIALPVGPHRTPHYPVWQFNQDRTVDPLLLEGWNILLDAADPWTAALWLCSSNPDLGNTTAIDQLRTRDDPAEVLAAARVDAARWKD